MVLASRVRLASLPDQAEETFIVSQLAHKDSWLLFKQMSRELPADEI